MFVKTIWINNKNQYYIKDTTIYIFDANHTLKNTQSTN